MLRVIGVIAGTVIAFAGATGAPRIITAPGNPHQPVGVGIAALLAAAHGAPPMICTLAARSVDNGGWGRWVDAPFTPLTPVALDRDQDRDDDEATPWSAADQDRLLAGLTSDDACVRELSVRLLGRARDDKVGSALIDRLGSSDPSLRAIAAFGLGLLHPRAAVDPLIKTLRDPAVGVKANAAWALGRMESGRALGPLIETFGDADTTVREAAIVAVGQLDSTSATAALTRVLQQDASPSVRRVAAWALGNLEAKDAARSSPPH